MAQGCRNEASCRPCCLPLPPVEGLSCCLSLKNFLRRYLSFLAVADPRMTQGAVRRVYRATVAIWILPWRANPKWGWGEVWFESQAGNQEVLSPREELFTQGPTSAFHLSKPPFPLWLGKWS